MNESSSIIPTGLIDFQEDVRRQVERQHAAQNERHPLWTAEIAELDLQSRGFMQSLANPNLSPVLRQKLDEEFGAALERKTELESILSERDARGEHAMQLVSESQVIDRLQRLSDVLESGNPTLSSIELALHIERIDCFHDERVVMRTCKLRGLHEVVDLLADVEMASLSTGPEVKGSSPYVANPRRRGRRKYFDHEHGGAEARAMADFSADVNRFAGLSEDWFWIDEFVPPQRQPSWAAQHAEVVFQRRQEAKLSLSKLALEFGVTAPTIRAALKHYQATHPGERDEVKLRAGGKRGARIDVGRFAEEARQLWEGGRTKEVLAEKYGCSTPVINKALELAYARLGLPMPTRQSKQASRAAEARRQFDEGASLGQIAKAMKVSTTSARDYLKTSFVAEGKTMPDVRRRKDGSA